MELEKQPETEMEYWEAIEALGGFSWYTRHDISHGRIEDTDGSIMTKVEEVDALSIKLAQEVAEKFNVILPTQMPKRTPDQERPPAPEGKVYYFDWYDKCKRVFYQDLYDKIICSACPLSNGLDYFIQLNQIPCGVFRGALYHLRANHMCGMLTYHDWTTQHLHSAIFNKGGKETLAAFKTKAEALKTNPQPKV